MKLKNLVSKGVNASVYKEDGKAIKVFNKDFPKSEVLNEALNTARVEETGLNIPKISEVSIIDGQWAISMDYIEGDTLAKLMNDNPDKMDEYLNIMVDIQLDMMTKRCPLLNKLKDKMTRQIQSLDIDEGKKYDLLTRLDGMPKHVKLCHGDFNPNNIIVSNGKYYILDWVHAAQGNASADVARTYLLFALDDKDVAEKYMDIFCKKSNTEKKYVQQWLPIVAAAQLTKQRPREKEMLEQWLDVFDFQ